jgi:hypothetical protein
MRKYSNVVSIQQEASTPSWVICEAKPTETFVIPSEPVNPLLDSTETFIIPSISTSTWVAPAYTPAQISAVTPAPSYTPAYTPAYTPSQISQSYTPSQKSNDFFNLSPITPVNVTPVNPIFNPPATLPTNNITSIHFGPSPSFSLDFLKNPVTPITVVPTPAFTPAYTPAQPTYIHPPQPVLPSVEKQVTYQAKVTNDPFFICSFDSNVNKVNEYTQEKPSHQPIRFAPRFRPRIFLPEEPKIFTKQNQPTNVPSFHCMFPSNANDIKEESTKVQFNTRIRSQYVPNLIPIKGCNVAKKILLNL